MPPLPDKGKCRVTIYLITICHGLQFRRARIERPSLLRPRRSPRRVFNWSSVHCHRILPGRIGAVGERARRKLLRPYRSWRRATPRQALGSQLAFRFRLTAMSGTTREPAPIKSTGLLEGPRPEKVSAKQRAKLDRVACLGDVVEERETSPSARRSIAGSITLQSLGPRRSSSCAWQCGRWVQSVARQRAVHVVECFGGAEKEALDSRRSRHDLGNCAPLQRAAAVDGSIIRVPLLTPRIAVHVVPAQLPEAGLVPLRELKTVHPLRRLPEVEMRYEQARRPPVVAW